MIETPQEASTHFAFDGALIGCERLEDGLIHASYLATCQERRYVLQRLNTTVFPDPAAVMHNIVVVLPALAYPLTFVPTSSGALLWRGRDGSAWRAYEYVDGVAAGRCDAIEVGRAFGELHRRIALAPIEPAQLVTTLPGFHEPAARIAALEAVLARDPLRRARSVSREIEVVQSLSWLVSEPGPPNLPELPTTPLRIAHFDAKAANVIMDPVGRRARAIVDLDTMMPGSWLWDVGDMVRDLAASTPEDEPDPTKVVFELDRYRTIVDAWRTEVDDLLTDAERAAVPTAVALITYEQAVRFLTDYLAGDVYYRIDRPDHNRDRVRAQLALLQSILEQRSAMILHS